MNEKILIDPKVCHGQACITGTRIPVYQVVSMLANGDTIDDLLGAYPSIKREDVLACLEYAAALTEEQITPIESIAPSSDESDKNIKKRRETFQVETFDLGQDVVVDRDEG